MPRLLRFIPNDHVVEVTCRTIQSRYLLHPSSEFEDITIGVLGRTQELTGMKIHGYSFLSNHFHLLLQPDDAAQLARFMCLFNSKLAREAGKLHDWRDRVWGRRYRAIVIADEEGAQAARLKYLLTHGCKEGLVGSPRDWPGATCVRSLLTGVPAVGTWFDRTREYNARRGGLSCGPRDFATTHRVVLSPLPCWQHMEPEAYRLLVASIVREIEEETAAEARASGRRPVGAAFVRRLHPHDRPVETKRSPAPAFHAATRAARETLREAYRAFLGAYRCAADRLAGGDCTAVFPERSFPPALPFVRGPNVALG